MPYYEKLPNVIEAVQFVDAQALLATLMESIRRGRWANPQVLTDERG
jgi:hypothetical protein